MIRLAFIDLGTKLIQYFAEVSKSLEPDVHACFYCIKPKPFSMSQRLGLDTHPANLNLFNLDPLPKEVEQQILNVKIITENPDKQLLSRKLSRLYYSLQAFLEKQHIDAIFLWNGSNIVARTASFLAEKNNLKAIYGENGYFHNTIQLDPKGVNQAASITSRIKDEYQQVAIDEIKLQQLRDMIEQYLHENLPKYTPQQKKIKASLSTRLGGEIHKLLRSDLKFHHTLNKNIPTDPGTLPENYIFIPLQVIKDSQLLIYSPLVGNDMEYFISTCHDAVRQVAKDYRIVIKLHPADLKNIDYSNLARLYPDVIWLKGYPINRLIQGASLVITINSTVGLEALLYNKAVITLGDNFYNVPEIVYHINRLQDLPEAIKYALANKPDKQKIQQLLYYLYHHYFTHGSWKNYSMQSINAVANKIRSLLKCTDHVIP